MTVANEKSKLSGVKKTTVDGTTVERRSLGEINALINDLQHEQERADPEYVNPRPYAFGFNLG